LLATNTGSFLERALIPLTDRLLCFIHELSIAHGIDFKQR
jgi:hypothetical protein